MPDTAEPAGQRARRALVQRLESLHRAGVSQLGKPQEVAAQSITEMSPPPPESPSQERPMANNTMNRPVRRASPKLFVEQATISAQDRPAALAVVEQEVRQCVRCPELVNNRTQTVFGVGDPQARLCFFGEAPGADEDRQGEPFVGRAGVLLNRIIEACGLTRQEVYILNVLKCRPPGNRTPGTEEVAQCRGYFERQLDIIQPEFICCLGLAAASALLETTSSISRLRGRFHDYRSSQVIVTYHPAYLLRNPAAKQSVWEDMQMLMREMGIEIPPRKAK